MSPESGSGPDAPGGEGRPGGDPAHQRRKRYRGTHPRHFSEKYKEHRAADYPEDVARILARGATPAGSHRPILAAEVLACLEPRPGETGVDATLGHGGHARALLEALTPGGHLYGFDRDAVELERSMGRICLEAARCLDREVSSGGRGPKGEPALFIPVHASFAELREVLDEAGLDGVDLILADLGLSSMQIDDPARGFSFKRRGPLDMRMDGSRGPTAAAWLESADEAALARALRDNADLEEAEDIARAVCLRRGRLATTRDLAEAVCSALPSLRFEDPATRKLLTRVFQAIRIEVNGEFSALATLLRLLPSCLNPGGRVAILSFHSGEERRVEEAFAAGLAAGHYASIAPEAIRPGREERNSNPRSVSASLRWARSPGAAGSRAYSGIHS